MDVSLRVAARFFVASLVETLRQKISDLLDERPLDPARGKAIAQWMADNFYFLSPKTPRGQKQLKELLGKLHWWLLSGLSQHKDPEIARETITHTWSELEPHLADLGKYFSGEGGKVVPKDLTLDGHTFINGAGLEEKKLHEFAARLNAIFKDLKGWRKGALSGGIKVLLASPKDFGGGTAGGKYKSDQDVLYVRTTPQVLKREGSAYGGVEYIIVHELGHRYERKHHVTIDYDRPEWWTTPYSKKEGEAFAELFALTNFGITSAHTTWDPSINERFDKQAESKPKQPLPEHLQKLVR